MVLNNLNFTPTMRCNLRCENCGVLVPHYNNRPHMDISECEKNLNAVFELVDFIKRFQVTGGEPLIHNLLGDILDLCFKYESKFDEFWLFSNGSVPLREDVVSVLEKHKDKTLVHCSDYGASPEVSKNNIDILRKYDIPYRYLKYYGDNQYYDGWVDQGDFVAHDRSIEENKRIFRSCTHVKRGGSWYLRNGQLHWCGRSIRGMEVGRIPIVKADFLDLFEDIDISEKRAKMEKLMRTEVITACDYCNGLYGTEENEMRIPAGRQMK